MPVFRRASSKVWVILVPVIAALAGCSNGRLVLALALDPTLLAPPSDARALRSTEAAVRGIAAIMAKNFGLPVPGRVTVYLYAGRQAFEQGLIHDADLTPVRAAELSNFAIGIGLPRQLLLMESGPERSEREWLRLIAHELTHVSQIELAGGEGRGEQWLAEGMAEWVAFATLEHLGLDTMSRRRLAATSGIRTHSTLIQARLDLEKLGTPRGFTAWHSREGSLPIYQLAFLIADYLIQRRGLDRVVAYFTSFTTSRDRHANFRHALGETLPDFEASVLAHLKATVDLAATELPLDASSPAPGVVAALIPPQG
ncbi:MAG: hypothetical protein HYV93_22710 [Candidatus Rokubacteria bacterium]|nr:hypothetical protein [Candidatus Rokubacteria bacterium]